MVMLFITHNSPSGYRTSILINPKKGFRLLAEFMKRDMKALQSQLFDFAF
jgi:hypothetical protein